ncbi:MAG TPA: hypothetical protein PKJ16_04135 [Spirochaetota bacterium]|nr:hypothetical protein [Spirochaetota bacterium]
MRNETVKSDGPVCRQEPFMDGRRAPVRDFPDYYYVYIMTDPDHELLFVGVSGNLKAVMAMCRFEFEYDHGTVSMEKLVYYEIYDSVESAVMRNRDLHLLSHDALRHLVNATNVEWADLFEQLDGMAATPGGV